MSVGKWPKSNLTKKQKMIMETLSAGNVDASGALVSWLDMDQLLERLPYRTTKASMNFSVRYLAQKEMISKTYETRREKRRAVFIPTQFGFSLVNSVKPAGFYEDDDIVETF